VLLVVGVTPATADAETGPIHFQSARGVDCYYETSGWSSGGGLLGAPRTVSFTGGVSCNQLVPYLTAWSNIFNERASEPLPAPPKITCFTSSSCYSSTTQTRSTPSNTYYSTLSLELGFRGNGDRWVIFPPVCTTIDLDFLSCLFEPAWFYGPV